MVDNIANGLHVLRLLRVKFVSVPVIVAGIIVVAVDSIVLCFVSTAAVQIHSSITLNQLLAPFSSLWHLLFLVLVTILILLVLLLLALLVGEINVVAVFDFGFC